jgi:hypothetical protein
MAYTVPTFNLTLPYWVVGHTPAANPADGTSPAQLYVHSRADIDREVPTPFDYLPSLFIRVPVIFIATVHPPWVGMFWSYTALRFPSRYYVVRWWESCHAGFANEYLNMMVDQCNSAGLTPDPSR